MEKPKNSTSSFAVGNAQVAIHIASAALVSDLEDYFEGPRDTERHSKWPIFMRMHGSILPKMIVPLSFVGLWATTITLISKTVPQVDLGIESVLLVVTGFVVALALSFGSNAAYERYSDGRKYWSTLLLSSRSLARAIWVHTAERHDESVDLGKSDLLGKLAALNLINAFAVSLKHRLRFEPSVEYPDLAPLLVNLHVLASKADQAPLRQPKASALKHMGQVLGLSFAESNPRKLIKKSQDNLGNTPLEVLTYLGAYLENVHQDGTMSSAVVQSQAMASLYTFIEVLTGAERVLSTPLPTAYSISISQITWAYVLSLPFQLIRYLGWVTIPGTVVAGYIILGLAQIARELENPFGADVNDLPLDAYCREIANDMDALTSEPAPLDPKAWMRDGAAKILWPFSDLEYAAWEAKDVDEIREALKAKASSRETRLQRMHTMILSSEMTNEDDRQQS